MNSRAFEILDWITEGIDRHGYPPTIREIGERFGIRSTNGVRYYLGLMVADGWIERDPVVARGMRLLRRRESSIAL